MIRRLINWIHYRTLPIIKVGNCEEIYEDAWEEIVELYEERCDVRRCNKTIHGQEKDTHTGVFGGGLRH